MCKALCFSLGAALLILELPCSAQGPLDGVYSGQYTGAIVQGGQSEPTAGLVQFVVANNVGTMTAPGPGTGTTNTVFVPEIQFSGVVVGNASCNFSGSFAGGPLAGFAYTIAGSFSCSSPDGAISGSWTANRSGDGTTQVKAILPTTGPSGEYVFNNVPGKLWFDPPAASAFEYKMTSGSLFTSILDFPDFFDNPFTVSTGGVVLGTFIEGQSVVFPNGGVSDFIVSGITPSAFPGNTAAFPLKLDFNTPTASFTQKQICLYALTAGPVNTIIGDFNTISLGGLGFTSQGGSGTVTITTDTNCPWTIGTPPAGVILTSASSGTGSATVTFQVLPNSGGDLNGSFSIAGQTFTVEQQAPAISGLNFVGSIAHLAAEENWTSTFTLVNKGTESATARLSFFGDALDPSGNGPLTLPLTFPQQPLAPGPLLAASFDQTLGTNASLIATTAGLQTHPPQSDYPPVLVGSAQLAATGAVDGFVIFHQILTAQEAVVPMETRNANSYLLAFDNTNGLVLGVAVENVSAQNAVIPVIVRDDAGSVISNAGTVISLGGNGHFAFVLSDPALGFPVTANIRGTIEFDTPAGGQISVLGLRFSPPNNALTTIPALANVGTGGGSIAHLASGGDGWQTTFVLVNTGTSAAPATLNFFADMTGAPLSLPLSFPQTGVGTTMTVPSYTAQLAPGATLVIVSNGAPTLLTGSAQLSTTGNVSGFVIFRHNNQEAVVPMENRNANAYILAFDNTGGTFTGIAVNNISAQAVSVPVIVRDDSGAQIATDTLNLAPNGHIQFTLVTDKYAGTANIRGTIEFDKPANGQIGALGIRIPAGVAHTYTTLPALSK